MLVFVPLKRSVKQRMILTIWISIKSSTGHGKDLSVTSLYNMASWQHDWQMHAIRLSVRVGKTLLDFFKIFHDLLTLCNSVFCKTKTDVKFLVILRPSKNPYFLWSLKKYSLNVCFFLFPIYALKYGDRGWPPSDFYPLNPH